MRLANHFLDFFAFRREFLERLSGKNSMTLPEFRARLNRLFSGVESGAGAGQVQTPLFQVALDGVCDWLEETVEKSSWAHASVWLDHPPRPERKKTDFYRRIQSLNPMDCRDREVMELYLLLLHFGYRGKYAGSENERQKVFDHLCSVLVPDGDISLSVLLPQKDKVQKRSKWSTRVLLAVGFFLLLILFDLFARRGLDDLLDSFRETLQ